MARPVTREQQARAMYGTFLARDFDLIAAELHPAVGHLFSSQDGKIRRLEQFRTAKDAMHVLGASA